MWKQKQVSKANKTHSDALIRPANTCSTFLLCSSSPSLLFIPHLFINSPCSYLLMYFSPTSFTPHSTMKPAAGGKEAKALTEVTRWQEAGWQAGSWGFGPALVHGSCVSLDKSRTFLHPSHAPLNPQSFISRGLIPMLLSIVTTNRVNGNENACSTVKSSPRVNHCSLRISWNTEG